MLFTFLFAQMPQKVVEIEQVKKQKFVHSVRLIGQVMSHHYAPLSAKVAGVLGQINMPCGPVKKGDKVAHLENESLKNRVETLQKTEALEKDQFDRAERLRQKGAISPRDLDMAQREYLTASNQYYQALQELEATEFKTPFDGVLGVYHFTPGMPLKTGDNLVFVYDPEKLYMRCDISDNIASGVKIGTTATIDNQKYQVDCVQKDMVDPISKLVPLIIDTPGLKKLIGTEVTVDLVLAEKEDTLTVPQSAIMIRGNKHFVYVIKDNTAIKQKVLLGIRSKDRIEVTEGLKEGDQVVIKGVTRLFPGVKVKCS